MDARVSARLTPREGRRFAFPVGAAFLVLAAIVWWRNPAGVPWRVLAGLGVGLLAAGAAIPGRLGPVYRGWMAFAHLLSRVTTPVFLSVVYFLVITPVGLLMRALGKRPLRHGEDRGGFWHPPASGGRSDLTHQF